MLASRNRVCDMAEQTPTSEPCCCKRCLLCSPSCCHLSLCLYHCSVPAENYLNYSLTHVLGGQRLSQVVQLTVRSPVLLVQSVPMELTGGPAAARSLTVPRESALEPEERNTRSSPSSICLSTVRLHYLHLPTCGQPSVCGHDDPEDNHAHVANIA